MGKIVSIPDFFQRKLTDECQQPFSADQLSPSGPISSGQITIEPELLHMAYRSSVLLRELSAPELAAAVEQAVEAARRERFSVTVVGEFSRGKSTFLNTLLGKEILPVGNLPTTAVLTRIRYHDKPSLTYFDAKGKRLFSHPLSIEAWEGLIRTHTEDASREGTALVGIDNPWLRKTGIELVDTPGAGDLEKTHAKIIGEALLGADGAVIAVSALAALSMSEKLFLEQRLLSHKVPHLMIILTKLDQVPLKERAGVIRYVQQKLASWEMDIPLFLPYPVELEEQDISIPIGIDRVRDCLRMWRCDPKREALTNRWLAARIAAVLKAAQNGLEEQQALLQADAEKREELIEQKRSALSRIELSWEDLRLDLMRRCNQCCARLHSIAADQSERITEQLQYEASNASNPHKWWTENYPYRLKLELTRMASSVDRTVSQIIAKDAGWFSGELEHRFQSRLSVRGELDGAAPASLNGRRQVKFENLDKKRNVMRIGTTVLTIGGALVCSGLGVLPLIVTMGVGTGSTILSEQLFRNKIEKQREAVREAIAVNVPELTEEAAADSEARLRAVYDSILTEARKQEALWTQAQRSALAQSATLEDGALAAVSERLAVLRELERQLDRLSQSPMQLHHT